MVSLFDGCVLVSRSPGPCGGAPVAARTGMLPDVSELEPLTAQIIGCAVTVHEQIGPGLLESVYRRCLALELQAQDLLIDTARGVPLVFRDVEFPRAYEIDILVENKVVVEVKAVASLARVHEAQLITYLKLMNCSVGLLINFNVPLLKQGLRRVEHPEVFRRRFNVANERGKT